ncbi:MAG: SCO1664 family protein [Deltaproteobacteria bacterium]|nr:SCO1664 family protein [Deltaproteobacteria bacterium]MBI3076277.1 SCO1664 family protein [Deltaproteobacteria bacterium]
MGTRTDLDRGAGPSGTTSLTDERLLEVLSTGAVRPQGLFPNASNYTFLVSISHDGIQGLAVYKPCRGQRPLWDFPAESLPLREVAAYLVSEVLGWRFVPPTVYRDGPHGPGSVQLFVEADPEKHYFNFEDSEKPALRPVALFDALVNNADRKAGHVLKDRQGRLWLIDHGICFHEEPKLRTVVWDFAGEPIGDDLLGDLRAFRDRMERDQALRAGLETLLAQGEIAALARRADRLLKAGRFPNPGPGRPYPWPPL